MTTHVASHTPPQSMAKPRLRALAVILDLDGTLLDTERATRGVMKDLLALYGKVPDPAKEERRLGQTYKESASAILADYELPITVEQYGDIMMPMYRERWPNAKALPGVNRLLRHLHKHGIPMGLASNSMNKNIAMKISYQEGWTTYFSVILGIDDVTNGKPSPDIFLEAAHRLGVDISSCLVIEDSPVGVQAARASGAQVVAVPSLQGHKNQYTIADVILSSLLEFHPEHWGLPAFDDWVSNALHIEPLFLNARIDKVASSTCFSIIDVAMSLDIPDQLSGVYFGWARIGAFGVFKMVVSTGWDLSSHPAKRLMLASVLGYDGQNMNGVMLDLLVSGYIRKLHNKDSVLDDLEITKEDEDVAANALDLPTFSRYKTADFLSSGSKN